jgi:hypothetical protein
VSNYSRNLVVVLRDLRQPGVTSYIDLVSTAAFTQPSIADIAEDKLVERLFADPLWGNEFFDLAGMPRKMLYKLRVQLNTAPGNFKGDIDVLRCAPDHPEQAVAYQLKRIKFGMDQLRNGKPTKLREYSKVARQANLVARMGFWQVYAYVVVVVDAREQNAGKGTTYERAVLETEEPRVLCGFNSAFG